MPSNLSEEAVNRLLNQIESKKVRSDRVVASFFAVNALLEEILCSLT